MVPLFYGLGLGLMIVGAGLILVYCIEVIFEALDDDRHDEGREENEPFDGSTTSRENRLREQALGVIEVMHIDEVEVTYHIETGYVLTVRGSGARWLP